MKLTKFFPWLVILFFTFITLFLSWSQFTTADDVDYFARRYSRSQYILGDAAPDKISDAVLYIYAGHNYLKGEDPTTINFEHPPWGKYVSGLSYLLLGNSLALNLPIFALSFILFYFLVSRFIESEPLKIITLLLLFCTRIMPVYVGFGLLDGQQLLYTLLFFSALFWQTPRLVLKYLLVGLFLGMVAAVKYPVIVLPLFVPVVLYYAYQKKELKVALISFLSAGIFYLLTYVVYFLQGRSILDFIKFEWFRFRWWTGERTIPKFLILQTIFTGRFKGWWAEDIYEYASAWNILWPTLCVTGVAATLLIKKNLELLILSYYSLGLFLFYIFGSASNERYLIQLFPFWVLMVMIFIQPRLPTK